MHCEWHCQQFSVLLSGHAVGAHWYSAFWFMLHELGFWPEVSITDLFVFCAGSRLHWDLTSRYRKQKQSHSCCGASLQCCGQCAHTTIFSILSALAKVAAGQTTGVLQADYCICEATCVVVYFGNFPTETVYLPVHMPGGAYVTLNEDCLL